MWLAIVLLLFVSNEAQSNNAIHFSSRSNNIPTFVINRPISHNVSNSHSAAHTIRNTQAFQKQAYENDLAYETTKLLALYQEALQKKEYLDKEDVPAVYNTQKAATVNQNNNHASNSSHHSSISPEDIERCAIKQSEKELKHLAALAEEYEHPDEYHNNLLAFDHIASRQKRRHKALQTTLADYTRFEKNYELTQHATLCMQQHDIQKALFTHCTGTHIQQALHEEFLELIEEMPTINERLKKKEWSTELNDHIIDFATIGCEFNHAGYITKSMTIADFCWGLKEVAIGMCYEMPRDMFFDFWATVQTINTKSAMHLMAGIPLGIYHAGQMLVKVVSEIGTLAKITIVDFFDEQLSKELSQDFTDRLMAFDTKVKHAISALGPRGVAREGSKAYIEAGLTGKAFSALGKFSHLAKVQGIAYTKKVGRKIQRLTKNEQVLASAEGFMFPVVEHAYQYMEDAQKIGKKVAGVAKSSIETAVDVSAKAIKPFFHAVLSETELLTLRKKFDGLIKFKDLVLEFCYEHLFNGEVYKNGSLGGLHHDFGGMLQKAGTLKLHEIKKLANGYYQAKIWCNAKKDWLTKTFFPDHYTKENVIQKVIEALKNPNLHYQNGLREVIEGFASDGMVIRIVTEGNRVITAFPYMGK